MLRSSAILAVAFLYAGGGAAVAAMTGRTAELVRLMNLQQFFTRMTDERGRQLQGLRVVVLLDQCRTRTEIAEDREERDEDRHDREGTEA